MEEQNRTERTVSEIVRLLRWDEAPNEGGSIEGEWLGPPPTSHPNLDRERVKKSVKTLYRFRKKKTSGERGETSSSQSRGPVYSSRRNREEVHDLQRTLGENRLWEFSNGGAF